MKNFKHEEILDEFVFLYIGIIIIISKKKTFDLKRNYTGKIK